MANPAGFVLLSHSEGQRSKINHTHKSAVAGEALPRKKTRTTDTD